LPSVQLRDEGAPQFEPHALFLPIAQTPPAGGSTGILGRQIAPAGAAPEHPENAFEHGAVVRPGPSAAFVFGQERSNAFPLLFGKKRLWHPQLFTKTNASYQQKITPNDL
jgi:hypothetical protein